jgi:hypothetical protein
MSLRREQLATLAEAERDLEQPVFNYPAPPDTRSVGFPCIPSVLRRGLAIQVGANEVEIQLEVKIRRELFGTADSLSNDAGDFEDVIGEDVPLPISGKLGVFEGVTYRVLQVDAPPGHGYLNVILGDRYSGKRK